ncbi:MAG: hypothetical protein NT069_06945, partial [Planctomycetota bacterium]|nr:hypothetical protein [Planctomycetota bacterium]
MTFSTNEEQLSIDGLFDRLGALELSVGLANEPFPSIRIACASLRSKFTANKSENGITLQLPFESFAPQGLIEPGFDVRRVALDGWEESDESAFSTMGVLGHGERFVVLPYSREILLARSPGSPGGIRLDDPSDLHDPLELREPFSGENPA